MTYLLVVNSSQHLNYSWLAIITQRKLHMIHNFHRVRQFTKYPHLQIITDNLQILQTQLYNVQKINYGNKHLPLQYFLRKYFL